MNAVQIQEIRVSIKDISMFTQSGIHLTTSRKLNARRKLWRGSSVEVYSGYVSSKKVPRLIDVGGVYEWQSKRHFVPFGHMHVHHHQPFMTEVVLN